MDIVVNLSEEFFVCLLNDLRNYNKQPGYHFFIVKRKLPKSITGNRMYFQYDRYIVGYGAKITSAKIDDDVQSEFKGIMWKYKKYYMVLWPLSIWYKEKFLYDIWLKQHQFKEFNLKKALNGTKEPDILSEGELWKARGGSTGIQLTSETLPKEIAKNVTEEVTSDSLQMARRMCAPVLGETIDLKENTE